MKSARTMNQNGFTLVEVLVTVGIWAVVILTLVNVQKSLIDSRTSGAASYEYASLISEISAIMSTEQGCRTALGGPVLRITDFSSPPYLPSQTQRLVSVGGRGQLGGVAPSPGPNPPPLMIYHPFMPPQTTYNLMIDGGAPPMQIRRIREWEITEMRLRTMVNFPPGPPQPPFPATGEPLRFPAQLDVVLTRPNLGGSVAGVGRALRGIIQLSLEVDSTGAILSCGPFSFSTTSTVGYAFSGTPICIDGEEAMSSFDGIRPICMRYKCPLTSTRIADDPVTGEARCNPPAP